MTRPTVRSYPVRGGLAVLIGLLFLSGCLRTQMRSGPVFSDGPPQGTVPPPPPLDQLVGNATPRPGPVVKDPYVAELLGILQETKSVDAFLMTLGALVDAQADHRQVVPTVIRNAERLGIYGRHMLKDEAGPEADAFKLVSTMISRLSRGASGAECEQCSRPASAVRPAAFSAPPPNDAQDTAKSDYRTRILPPLRDGSTQAECKEPPSTEEVLRAMTKVSPAVPGVFRESRADIQITTELLVDKVDPPRFYPLVGSAQLHHCHWKCVVAYTKTIEMSYPVPFRMTQRPMEVVYIDRDHLHLCPGTSKYSGER